MQTRLYESRPLSFGKIFLKMFFKRFSKAIQFFLLNLYYYVKVYVKDLKSLCNFQKFKSLFVSLFSVKNHMLQCLMSVFEGFLFIGYFSN